MSIKKISRLVIDGQLSNFYDAIIKEINDLVSEENYQEAIDRISEELSQPYCPLEYYDKLFSLRAEIIKITENITFEENFWKKEPSELIRLVYSSSDNQKFEYWSTLVQKIEIDGFDINKLKKDILNILSDEKIKLDLKISMVYDLADLGFDHEVLIYNNNLKKEIAIIPTQIDVFKMQQNYHEAFQIIYNQTFKEVTINNFCLDILEAIRIFYFPIFPSANIDEFCETIIDIVNNMIDSELNEFPKNECAELIFPAIQELIGS